MLPILALVLLGALPAGALEPVAAPPPEAVAAAEAQLTPHGATLVVRDAASDAVLVRVDPARAAERQPPCSTFKIPNTLISLTAGAVTLDDNHLRRDRETTPTEDWWPKSWDRDHDLQSALESSALWYFQELARRVGIEEMQRQVDRLNYGNRDLSGGVDRFWLSSSLTISADEQTEFLGRLVRGEYGFAAADLVALKEGIRRGG
ncbi:MAG TPA: penicillin-binding transpeptidase domain-containing protein, partial [Thermoanaerobaculia bacterium]|nr:penicillin-binding transpeptidase domain-containing protein [Thermoanaerobaculia bacterium]